ncbi:inverse autotransporter beta domain-containing protein [Enterobacter asburiae]
MDVPLMTAKENKTTSDAPSPDTHSSTEECDKQAQKVAGYASQAGSFLAGSAKSDAAASMVLGIATGEAGGAIQQWLSNFGTARVQLDADKNFSLKNSQFSLLMPLYDLEDNLVFTQGSLHRTDSRTLANLGVGLRHFTPTYMLGENLFGDYDLSRDNARMGVGVEYWRDFLKLDINDYMHLTGWKDSPDLADYQERPANGWDIRAQAWVPSLPQLGGRLAYEQYYGKEVALFGVDNRQKNPHAITAGVNYTPVPLITLGAEQRQGQSGKSDTRLTMGMNYQLGVPWRAQVDPMAVAAMRSLTGSRYDLVERNNNIVLEYRKKEVIRLHTADLVTGHPGDLKSLGVSVTSTYGLSRIDWDAQDLITAGGKVIQNGMDYAVLLPAYQSSAQGLNTYTISGVAVDTKGNHSDRSDTQLTVQAPEVNKQTSTLTPTSSVLPADGKSTQLLTLTLRDENNQAVDIDVKDISLKNSELKSAAVSALTRKSAGVYTVTVTSGTDAENVTLTPAVSGILLSPAVVVFNSIKPDAGQSVFTTSPEAIAADNVATSTLTLAIKDAQGNSLAGLKDHLVFVVKDSRGKTPASGVITESAIMESSIKGTYTADMKGAVADKYTVVPEYNGTAIGSLNTTVTLTSNPSYMDSAIVTDRASYVAGEDMTVTVTLKDAQGNAVTGASALLTGNAVTVPDATLKSGGGWKDNGDGTYTTTYTASTAGTGLKAALKLAAWSGATESAVYDITADQPAQSQSGIVTDRASYVAGEDMTVTVTLKDAQGNAVTGASALLTGNAVTVPDATLKSGGGWKDNGDGTYTTTYTASTAGTGLKAALKLAAWSGATESAVYDITADQPAQSQSGIVTDRASYVAGEDMTVTVTLKDAQGNAVTGASALLTGNAVTVPDATLKSGGGWKDNGDGTYTTTYTASTAGTGLKAALKLAAWSGATESAVYDITADQPAQSQSGIVTDRASYVAGEDMTVTVTLKDAQGNAVTGASALLTGNAVTVPDATLKSGGGWKDNGDGTYTTTYTASTAGTGLKAALKLAAWSGATESAVYDITADQPAQSQSGIVTDRASYVAGEDMTVTVTLKDAQGNAVTGASALLTGNAVTVPDATLKSGGGWKDNGDGTYTTTYTASTAGTGLKAALKLAAWSGATESAVYDITADQPAQSQSGIVTDRASYVAGEDMTVTVTLKDAQGNAVTGASALLTGNAVTVPDATLKSGGGWKDNGDGTYTTTYTASTAGTGLKAALKLAAWSGATESAVYDITERVFVKDLLVGNYRFSPDSGFPSTGFRGAEFRIELNTTNVSDYDWASNKSWVSVSGGIVTFSDIGNNDTVTIIGRRKSSDITVSYTFRLSSWFDFSATTYVVYPEAINHCNNLPGYTLPTINQLRVPQGRGVIGAWWSEWGDPSYYSKAGIEVGSYWSSTVGGGTYPYYFLEVMNISDGHMFGSYTGQLNIAVCRKDLEK